MTRSKLTTNPDRRDLWKKNMDEPAPLNMFNLIVGSLQYILHTIAMMLKKNNIPLSEGEGRQMMLKNQNLTMLK